jgi:cation transport regulator ChaB
MARGELSYSKVRALTRVASLQTEELLLSIALHGTAHHVETTVRCFRRAQQAEELSREARQQAARRVSCSYDADGSLVVKAVLPAETGALFVKALNAAVEAMEQQTDVSAETSARDVSAESAPGQAWRRRMT